MRSPIPASSLPGGPISRQFEGEAHGSGLSFFLVEAEPGRGPRLHRHPYEEVFIVASGRATFTLDGDEVEAGPEDVVVAPPGTPHRFVNSGGEPLRLTAIHLSPRFETEWLE